MDLLIILRIIQRTFCPKSPHLMTASILHPPLNFAVMSDLCFGVESQTQGILHLPGVSKIVYCKEPNKWIEELRIRQRKGYSMDYCGTEFTEPIQDGRQMDQIARDPIAPWCGPALFCLRFSLAEISMRKMPLFFIWRNKALLHLLTHPRVVKHSKSTDSNLLLNRHWIANITFPIVSSIDDSQWGVHHLRSFENPC